MPINKTFFYDPKDQHPVAYIDRQGIIHYNLSTMPDRVGPWVDLISHEWVAFLIIKFGYREVEWVIEKTLELAGLEDTFWGGVTTAI